MKYLGAYKILETKAKVNWLEKYNSKVKELRDMVYSNPNLTGHDMISDLILPLKDITVNFNIDVEYTEYIKFTNKNNDKDYIFFKLSIDGEVFTSTSSKEAYRQYTTKTKWLDKKRLSGIEVIPYYFVVIDVVGNLSYYSKFRKSKEFKGEWKLEFNDVMNSLESLGFKVNDPAMPEPGLAIKAGIKLDESYLSTKTLDLSDLVDPSILDDFERFVIKKNLSRSDAEEIVKIFNK